MSSAVTDSATILAGTVLTMTGRGRLRDHAITIEAGRITAITARAALDLSTVRGPVLDWRQRTVLPGLTDGHVHVDERAELLLTLAHGVTTVRNMKGRPWHLDWQRRVADGRELGPHLVTSSPMADGRGAPGTTVWPDAALIEDRAAGHSAVQRWAELGYQQVKAYQWLTADALTGLGEACRDAGLPLVGHCPQKLTVHEAIDCGQNGFEHLNNYEYGTLHQASQDRLDAFYAQGMSYGSGKNRFSPEAARAACDLDEAKLRDLAQRLAADNIMSCPTLIVLDRLLGRRDMSDPRLRYVDPVVARTWIPENDFRVMALTRDELQTTQELFRQRSRRILAALRDAGAPVIVGTDTHNAFVFQGSSLAEELQLMTQAGYTPLEALELATRAPADYLGLADRGRVDVGAVADLVAVDGDPLVSLDSLARPAGVVVGGTVLDRAALDAMLAEAEALLHATPDADRLRAIPPDERLIGDYERTNFGVLDAHTRVSCCADPGAGTTRWREQSVTRRRAETRVTVIDRAGRLVSAEVERDSSEGREAATVTADGSHGYTVRIARLDGSTSEVQLSGPLYPAADLGVPALQAAHRDGPAGASLPVLSVSTSLANSLPPVPGTVERDGTELVQHTTDAIARIRGDDQGREYTLTAPMMQTVHRRRDPL